MGKNFRKSIISFILSALTALTITACGNNADPTDVPSSDNTPQSSGSQTTVAEDSVFDTSNPDITTSQAVLKTPIDTITEDGVPIKSTAVFSEEDKSEILEAYKALKTFFDKHLNLNYPDGSQYIVSIDDVRHGDGLYSTRYPLESGFKPTKEFEFWVTCSPDYENLSSSHKNEWYIASKFDGEWTTYSEYMDTSKTPIDTAAED